jgi:hypothetical protein
MDRAILEQHLSLAERHATQGERHVARQRELVAKLVQGGHDTMEAEARLLLATFEELQGSFVADRDRLRAELARGSAYRADPLPRRIPRSSTLLLLRLGFLGPVPRGSARDYSAMSCKAVLGNILKNGRAVEASTWPDSVNFDAFLKYRDLFVVGV